MLSPRDAFLQRVRHAVRHGQRLGHAPPLPERGQVGYQGAGDDPLERFCQTLKAAGGQPHVVSDSAATLAKVIELVQGSSGNKVLLGRLPDLENDLAERLRSLGKEVLLAHQQSRDGFFAADVAVTGVAYLIAETGSIVVASQADNPRSASLLPPIHIAVAQRKDLLPDLFDLFTAGFPVTANGGAALPSGLTIITGPSKTGDIELRLVTGVHGPGEVHVVLQSS